MDNKEQNSKSKRGGARPGTGRPRSTVERIRKTLDLPKADAERIDQLASTEGISAHAWMLRAICNALDAKKGGD